MWGQYASAALFTYMSANIAVRLGIISTPIVLVGVVCVVLSLPYTRSLMHSRISWTKPIGTTIGLTIAYILLIAQVAAATQLKTHIDEADKIAIESAAAENAKKSKLRITNEFETNRLSIINEIQKSIQDGLPEQGYRLGSKFLPHISDAELKDLTKKAQVAAMRKELSSSKLIAADRKATIYETLLNEEPNNKLFKKQLADAKKEISLQSEKKKADEEFGRHVQSAKKQFTGWGGSHPVVVDAVKGLMHNPDSFEHVSTTYILPTNDTIRVTMRYRGTNGFGGVVTSTTVVTINNSGEVVGLKSL